MNHEGPVSGIIVVDGVEHPLTFLDFRFVDDTITLVEPAPAEATLTFSFKVTGWPWDKPAMKQKIESHESWRRHGKRKGRHAR